MKPMLSFEDAKNILRDHTDFIMKNKHRFSHCEILRLNEAMLIAVKSIETAELVDKVFSKIDPDYVRKIKEKKDD